jgi:hypothetical protein
MWTPKEDEGCNVTHYVSIALRTLLCQTNSLNISWFSAKVACVPKGERHTLLTINPPRLWAISTIGDRTTCSGQLCRATPQTDLPSRPL